ncbi:hypothetical protein Fmac_002974 [Flemingia macrophylla]|uniref:Uncharacterized protein n=1 Tax=Flemingia macrophylla TaxID=520843 RepID=A0ABD1NLF8_9FABA
MVKLVTSIQVSDGWRDRVHFLSDETELPSNSIFGALDFEENTNKNTSLDIIPTCNNIELNAKTPP